MKKVIIIGALLALVACLTGCTALQDKAVCVESKVYGLWLDVPNFNGSGALASIKFGFVSNRILTAPKGSEATIDTKYNDVNIWSLSGTVDSKLSASNTVSVIDSAVEK